MVIVGLAWAVDLHGVTGLAWDAEGLWVADHGSLTRRDPRTLEVLEEPFPGVDGWTGAGDGWLVGPGFAWRPADGALR
ncbi:MAG: hypothetical protein KC656_20505, partial [Myxococcales bacterium]|nr:hypothetical protein [Myxococcales bacterium]